MSFAKDVKGELARYEAGKKCCMLAEISGFLRVSGAVKLAGGGRFAITASTENAAIARHYKKLIKEYFGSTANLGIGESTAIGRTKGYRYYLTITPDEKSMQILRETGLMLIREGNDYFSDGIYNQIVRTKCCKKSYLRGMFLGCGTMSDPRSGYHLEFVVESKQLAIDTRKLIGSFVDLSANYTKRKEDYVVYMKKAAYISDMLNLIGAEAAVLDFENIRIGKEVKEETQRILNCDNANMDRALTAAENQLRWINKLKAEDRYDSLPPQLKEVAELRIERPEASLTEIGELLNPPINKSGVNKRFAKIKELI